MCGIGASGQNAPWDVSVFFFASIAIGAIFFAADAAISSSKGFPWVGGPLGSMLTLIVCPGLSLAAAGGIVRAYYLSRN